MRGALGEIDLDGMHLIKSSWSRVRSSLSWAFCHSAASGYWRAAWRELGGDVLAVIGRGMAVGLWVTRACRMVALGSVVVSYGTKSDARAVWCV